MLIFTISLLPTLRSSSPLRPSKWRDGGQQREDAGVYPSCIWVRGSLDERIAEHWRFGTFATLGRCKNRVKYMHVVASDVSGKIYVIDVKNVIDKLGYILENVCTPLFQVRSWLVLVSRAVCPSPQPCQGQDLRPRPRAKGNMVLKV